MSPSSHPSSSGPLNALRRVAQFCLISIAGVAFAEPEVPLWKEGAPDIGIKHTQPETREDRSEEAGRPDRWISFVSNPTLTVFPAAGAGPAPAVLVIPGGGFRYVCWDKEGIEAARWLNSLGVTAVVFKYRVLAPTTERTAKTVEPLFADTKRAMRVLRHQATAWKIDPKRIGVMGFSAGGTMAVRLMTESDDGNPSAPDPIDRSQSRPDFVALVYSGTAGGKFPQSKHMPPVFIAHATDDPKAPVSVATKIFLSVIENGGSAEMHLFRSGDHGFGITPKTGTAKAWTELCAEWMKDLGYLPR